MPIKFGDRLININPDYAVIDLTDNQSLGVFFFDSGITNTNLTNVPDDKRAFGMLGVDVTYNKVYIFTGSAAGHLQDGVFNIAPIADDGAADNTDAPDGTNGGTYWKEIGTIERRFDDISVAIADGKTFGKYRNDYDHPLYAGNVGVIPVTSIGGGAGMTALEIIIEALTEAQPLSPTLTVVDNTYPSTTETFPFGVTSGDVSATVSVDNINSNLFDSNGDAVTLDTTQGATCVLYYRDAVAPGLANNNGWNSMGSIPLTLSGDTTFGGSDTFAWTNTPQEWDAFYGFEYKVEIEDSLGMTGEAFDNINVSDYKAPVVSVQAERLTDMTGIYASNETDSRRIRGNTNTKITFSVTPQQQDNGGAATIIPVQNWKLYRSVNQSTTNTDLNEIMKSSASWAEIANGTLNNSSVAVNGITYNDYSTPDDASSVAYMVVVQDSYLETAAAALSYYTSFLFPGSDDVDTSSLASTGGGSNRFIQFQFPFFVGYANINGSTYAGNSNEVNSNIPLNEFGGVPTTMINGVTDSQFSVVMTDGQTSVGATGLVYDMNQFFGPKVDTSAFTTSGINTLDTFEANPNIQVTGDNRLVIAVAHPLGDTTPPEISFLEFSNSQDNNQVGAFSSAIKPIGIYAGPTGADQNTTQVANYRVYIANNVATPSANVTMTLTLPNN